jgi:hypothetical protein
LYFWGIYLLYNLHYVNQIGLFWENKAIEYQPLSTGRHIVSKINGKIFGNVEYYV